MTQAMITAGVKRRPVRIVLLPCLVLCSLNAFFFFYIYIFLFWNKSSCHFHTDSEWITRQEQRVSQCLPLPDGRPCTSKGTWLPVVLPMDQDCIGVPR